MEQTTSMILGPDGAPAMVQTVIFDHADAQLLRDYKKLLQRHGLKEALYCQRCWEGAQSDGCEAHVTSSQILIKCRCTIRFYAGSTY